MMDQYHVDQEVSSTNTNGRICPEPTAKTKMPLFKTLSPFGSFAFAPSPWFSHLFSNLVQHFRQLKAYRFLSQSILFLEIASAFRRPIFRLLKSVYYAPHDSLEYIDGGSALGKEISAVECVEVDDLKDHTKPVVQSPLAAGFVANVGGDVPYINNNMTVGDSRERLSDVSMNETHLHVQSMVDMSSIRESQVIAKIRRRALLIGVGNNLRREDLNDLPSTNDLPPANESSCREHRDVEDMRSLLEDMYGYDPNEIVSLLDDKREGSIHPTRENIVRQIQILVEGAKLNDHFFFYFVGHSFQEDTDDEEEEDRKNEFILTADGEEIMDNELRQLLVDPLPSTCSLTAIFDSCHSCSLLDLPHFRCNRVYVPWLNRGKRRTDTILAKNQRKLEVDHYFEHLNLDATLPNNFLLKSAMASPSSTRRATEFPPPHAPSGDPSNKPRPPIRRPRILTEISEYTASVPTSMPTPNSGRAIASPVSLYCHGNCRKDPIFMRRNVPQANVICLSSSKDSQVTWVRDGSTMTQFLVKMLREQPRRKLKDVLTLVSHDIHRSYIEMHDESRDYKRQVKKWNTENKLGKKKKVILPPNLEIHNFQDPQISSLRPLDMDRYFEP